MATSTAANRKHASKALVIKTVVSLENTDNTYFESQAPNWTWGCRFSVAYLVSIVQEAGCTVIRAEENELIENNNLSDRGSYSVAKDLFKFPQQPKRS